VCVCSGGGGYSAGVRNWQRQAAPSPVALSHSHVPILDTFGSAAAAAAAAEPAALRCSGVCVYCN